MGPSRRSSALAAAGLLLLAAAAARADAPKLGPPETIAASAPDAGTEVRAVAVAFRADGKVATGVLEAAKDGGESVALRCAGEPPAKGLSGSLALGADERLLLLARAGGDLVSLGFLRDKDRATLGMVGVTKEGKPAGQAFTLGKTQLGECAAAVAGPGDDVTIAYVREWHGHTGLFYGTVHDVRYDGAVAEQRVTPGCRPALALRPDGALLIAYRGEEDGDLRDIFLRVRAKGARVFGDAVRVSPEGWKSPTSPASGPSLLALDEKVALVAYLLPGETPRLFVTRSADGGRSFAAPVAVAAGRRPTLLALAGGKVALVFDAAPTGVALAISRDGGASFEKPVRLDEGKSAASGAAAAAAPDGKSVSVAWVEGEEARARRAILRRAEVE
jgi:hypothetical protein